VKNTPQTVDEPSTVDRTRLITRVWRVPLRRRSGDRLWRLLRVLVRDKRGARERRRTAQSTNHARRRRARARVNARGVRRRRRSQIRPRRPSRIFFLRRLESRGEEIAPRRTERRVVANDGGGEPAVRPPHQASAHRRQRCVPSPDFALADARSPRPRRCPPPREQSDRARAKRPPAGRDVSPSQSDPSRRPAPTARGHRAARLSSSVFASPTPHLTSRRVVAFVFALFASPRADRRSFLLRSEHRQASGRAACSCGSATTRSRRRL
jgi:hypothetical protein